MTENQCAPSPDKGSYLQLVTDIGAGLFSNSDLVFKINPGGRIIGILKADGFPMAAHIVGLKPQLFIEDPTVAAHAEALIMDTIKTGRQNRLSAKCIKLLSGATTVMLNFIAVREASGVIIYSSIVTTERA